MDHLDSTASESSRRPVLRSIERRRSGLCSTCRCTSIGNRVCRRGENGDAPFRTPLALTDCGVRPVPLILDPPNCVRQALAHYAASIASD